MCEAKVTIEKNTKLIMLKIQVVIAIKLGTNYSTNAYMKNCGHGEEKRMFTVPFKQQTTSQMSISTPTVALFTERGEIETYGFEAELKYAVPGKTKNHMLFREFIWNLFCADDTVPENLESLNGQSMKSLEVLSSVLVYMVNHVKRETGEMIDGDPINFKYVFTLPTCSCDGARRFMTEAAMKAGFSPEDFIIVEEAVAALHICLQKSPDDFLAPGENREAMFLVVECEDDNVHISILNHISEKAIEIKYETNAEVWASCQIQKDFMEMFQLITSESFLSYFFEKYPIEYFELLQDLKKKIKITSPDSSRVAIKMSALLLEKMRKKKGIDIQKAAMQTGLSDKVEFKMDKCLFSSEAFKSLFTDAGKNIVDFIENATLAKYPDINHIILVGEFAQSRILQDIIKSSFPSKRIYIPQDASMAAVTGALLMGKTEVSVATSKDFVRERTQIISDAGSQADISQTPRSYRTASGVTTTSKSSKSPPKAKHSNPTEKRNQSRFCVIQ